ncbi:hypothetical protein [Almyronema epifaneia]|uniref:Calcineurin-like phosphoesterase domain-containing protein n=1 Tax=Almyronema epifaneia S1 TaxID=2991925 RepID=A0ABW6IJ08_9CYAN
MNKLTKICLPLAIAATLMSAVLPKVWADGPGDEDREGRGRRAFQFALITDVPYNAGEVTQFDNVIAEINAERSLSFVLHGGDIKSGSSACSDQLFQERFNQYQKFNLPFIYTPGDNEWTDCHREAAGQFNPIERLAKIREIFYPRPGFSTGRRPQRVVSQASRSGFEKYVENQIWIKNGVVFSAIHVVGSNNNLSPWSGIGETLTGAQVPTQPNECQGRSNRVDLCRERTAEYQERLAAALDWLDKTFQAAERLNSAGVFILIHANPGFELATDDPERTGFNAFLEALATKSIEFGKPVVLAQGDSHFLLIDKPLFAQATDGSNRRIPNFTRIQAFGTPDVYWIRVTVDPNRAGVFLFEPVIVEENQPVF